MEERAYLATAVCMHRARWSLWAAKEAAFKVARKLDSDAWLSPREYVVRMVDGVRAEVEHRMGRFQVWLEHADEWVHAVAVPWESDSDRPPCDVTTVDATPWDSRGTRPGVRVRELARTALSAHFGIAPTDVKIVSEDRIPRASGEGSDATLADLSLSHDGRFAACAWIPRAPNAKSPAPGRR